jgi:hypothetical protein
VHCPLVGGDETVQYTLLKSGNQKIELLQFLNEYKVTTDGVINYCAFSVENIKNAIEKTKRK